MAAEPQQAEKELLGASPALSPPHPPFIEVACRSSGKVRRFASGTEAGYALYLINRKLDFGLPLALFIEAIKEGEEPVSFGPNAVLVNYGQGWSLQTITEDHGESKRTNIATNVSHYSAGAAMSDLTKKRNSNPTSTLTLLYIVKILLAFVFMFVLAGALTMFLENLPSLISLVSPFT